MTLNEYQTKAMRTCMDESKNLNYMALGLASEAGIDELTAFVQKVHTSPVIFEKTNRALRDEARDLLRNESDEK